MEPQCHLMDELIDTLDPLFDSHQDLLCVW